MAKLKIGIQQAGNIVFGRVLEQDENLRCGGTLYESNCLNIRSQCYPALCNGYEPCSGELFVRGNERSKDDDWFAFAYWSEEDARIAIGNIKLGVAAINRNVKADRPDCFGLEIVE